MRPVCRLLLAPVFGFLLIHCTKNPVKEEDRAGGDPNDSGYVLAQGLKEGSAQSASDMHQEAAAEDRVAERTEGAAPKEVVQVELGITTIGPPKGDPELSKGAKPKSGVVNALLKLSALGPSTLALAKAAAGGSGTGDSLSWVLADSSRGYVHAIRLFAFRDTAEGVARSGAGRDSTVYRWPRAPANPSVLSFHRTRRFDDGKVERGSAFDEDGDGLLSEAQPGRRVLIRRVWTLTSGDSAWTSETFSDHGQTTWFDSLGAGHVLYWTDTLKAGGKRVSWRKVYDGDGDGFALTAAGPKVKVKVDHAADLGDGTFRYGFETQGPGPDGRYEEDADNERYASSAMLINAQGEDVGKSESGDADGDGLLWSPAPGAENRVWETSVWFKRGDLKSYKDSAVKLLGPARDLDARVAYYGAALERADGERSVLAVSSPGGAAFGSGDTVQVTERIVHTARDAAWRDSTVRTSQLIPGRLDIETDDRLLGWTSQVFFNAASPLLRRSESFTASAPMARGAEARAGSQVVEDLYRESPGGLLRLWRRHDFDMAAGESQWKEVRSFKGGDSAVTSGGSLPGGGHAITHSRPGAKGTGFYDPASGAFADTVSWVDAQGKAAGRRASTGTWKDGVGAYAVVLTRADGKTRAFRVEAKAGADGARVITRVAEAGAEKDTLTMTARGDSVFMEKRMGGTTVVFALARAAGGYEVGLSGKDGTGSLVLRGDLVFGRDGLGAGELVEYAGGKAKPAVKFASGADGAVLLDDKQLP